MALKKHFIEDSLSIVLFFLIVFFLTRQMVFGGHSYIMNVALMLFVMLSIFTSKNIFLDGRADSFLVMGALICLSILSFYSMANGNEPENIVRFFIILSVLLLAYKVKPSEKYVNIFVFLVLLQAIIVVGIEFYVLSNFNLGNYGPFRNIFRGNEWGDVYSFNGLFWYVKIVGSALLPVGLFVSLIFLNGWKRVIICSIFFMSVFVANTAFVIAAMLFVLGVVILLSRWNYSKLLLLYFSMLLFLPFFLYVAYIGINKLNQSKETSMEVRYDQVDVLVRNMDQRYLYLLMGTGLGNTISEKTEKRDYTDDIYYEVQPMYILNQLGLPLFLLYIALHIILAGHYIRRKELLWLYICYILYASSNPYILDTTHFVVIVVLISLRKALDEKESICGFGCLQPRHQ